MDHGDLLMLDLKVADVCVMVLYTSDLFVMCVLKLSVTLRTLPPPCWEHHKPRNVTSSGSVEKQGRAKAAAAFCRFFLFFFLICFELAGGEPSTVNFFV